MDDLLSLLADWHLSSSEADVNSDGLVGVLDLLFLLADYGKDLAGGDCAAGCPGMAPGW